MNARLILDEQGRVALPKPLREELDLQPGDSLELESTGESITLRLEKNGSALPADERPIWDLIAAATSGVPDEELSKLPEDGASQHDHYLYGHSKRTA
jgi:AbrB family looped-hinge helix DNA binding protein